MLFTEAPSASEKPPPRSNMTPQANLDCTVGQFSKASLGYGPLGRAGTMNINITIKIAADVSLGFLRVK